MIVEGLHEKRRTLRVYKPGGDPKRHRTFVIVSRPALIDSKFPGGYPGAVLEARRTLSDASGNHSWRGVRTCELDQK